MTWRPETDQKSGLFSPLFLCASSVPSRPTRCTYFTCSGSWSSWFWLCNATRPPWPSRFHNRCVFPRPLHISHISACRSLPQIQHLVRLASAAPLPFPLRHTSQTHTLSLHVLMCRCHCGRFTLPCVSNFNFMPLGLKRSVTISFLSRARHCHGGGGVSVVGGPPMHTSSSLTPFT